MTEDVGHTVVQFLHTGGYETISSPLGEGTSDLAREYKRSVLVYHASRNWGLTDLEILAKQKMQHLDVEVAPGREEWAPAPTPMFHLIS